MSSDAGIEDVRIRDVLIRESTDADGPALAELIAGVFAEYEGCPFVAEEFPELAGVSAHFRGRGGHIWVAEAEGQVVGCFAMAPTHRWGVVEFFKVYVARSHRGQGIAGRLLAQAYEHARGLKAGQIILWSDTRFADGHRFYERHGFMRQPGIRALHDAGNSLEYCYRLDTIPA